MRSTNEEINRLLSEEELDEGLIVSTEYQSHGKGHQGNTWSSDKGMNLLFSVLLKPEFLRAENAFQISRIISLSIADMIDKQGIETRIKWPNDILIRDSKVCGILIENAISGSNIIHSVIGIGLNVNQEKFNSTIPSPTSLFLEKGCHFDRELLLDDFRSSLESWYQVLFGGNESTIMDAYLDRLYLINQQARYSDSRNEFMASIRTVLPGGELEIKTEEGEIRRFGFKEIEYLGSGPGTNN